MRQLKGKNKRMMINIDLSHSPTVYNALADRARVVGLMGPVGSGKSHGFGCTKLMHHANLQPVQQSGPWAGYRRSRYAVIRNTGPELKSTTIKTFTSIYPEGPHGSVVYSAPITYRMRFPPKLGRSGLDIEIMFLALDNPSDVKKLLSLELTGAFVNEGREIHRAVIDALTGRIGRFPSVNDGGCVMPQVWVDTNPCDETNWFYKYFEDGGAPVKFKTPDGNVVDLSYSLHKQPPAALELTKRSDGRYESIEPGFEYIFEHDEVLHAGGTSWGINPEAENLKNLEPAYYASQIINKTREYIRVYVQGKYGYVRTGKAVVPEFNEKLQVADIPLLDGVDIQIGIDIGGGTLTPAAVFAQVHPTTGAKLIHFELCAEDMGVDNFAKILKSFIGDQLQGFNIRTCYTDPAAEQRDQVYEQKINEYLRASGFHITSAPTNAWAIRRQAIADPCSRIIQGRPALLIHPRCKMLIEGLKGKWDFKKMKVVSSSGKELYADKPSKNEYSHPCDALGYVLNGLGEGQPLRSGRTPAQTQAVNAGFTAKVESFV
jgi:hypothetical protein